MRLKETFWKQYELDLQEVKLAYLNWAVGYAKEPNSMYRHLFLWEHQKDFCLVDSKYGRAFGISPFGTGVRGVPGLNGNGRRGIDSSDLDLKGRLTRSTGIIRSAIAQALDDGDIKDARRMVLNYFWLKLGPHELLFDRIQYGWGDDDRRQKGRFGFDESDGCHNLTGIRNRIINVIRYGERLQNRYVSSLDKKLPGFSGNTTSTFLSSAMTWNKYGLCAFDCGPVLWSKSGFVDFNRVAQRMKQIGWPYEGTAREVLRSLYHIAVDYRRPPIRIRGKPCEGYSLRSLRRRSCQINGLIDNTLNRIHKERECNVPGQLGAAVRS